jgi:hypothetical protein
MTNEFVFECINCGVVAEPAILFDECKRFASSQPHHWKAFKYVNTHVRETIPDNVFVYEVRK